MRHPKVDRVEALIVTLGDELDLLMDLVKDLKEHAFDVDHLDYTYEQFESDVGRAVDAFHMINGMGISEIYWKNYKRKEDYEVKV